MKYSEHVNAIMNQIPFRQFPSLDNSSLVVTQLNPRELTVILEEIGTLFILREILSLQNDMIM